MPSATSARRAAGSKLPARGREVEAEHEVAGDLVLLEHHRHGGRLVDGYVSRRRRSAV